MRDRCRCIWDALASHDQWATCQLWPVTHTCVINWVWSYDDLTWWWTTQIVIRLAIMSDHLWLLGCGDDITQRAFPVSLLWSYTTFRPVYKSILQDICQRYGQNTVTWWWRYTHLHDMMTVDISCIHRSKSSSNQLWRVSELCWQVRY